GQDRELTLRMIYDSGRFDAATIARMLGHVQMLLYGIATEPARRLVDLPLLTDTEWQQIRAWNANETADPHDQCVHQRVETQVTQAPDAIAVVFDGRPTKDEIRDKETRRQGDKETSGPTTDGDGSVFSVQRSAFSVS